MCNFFFHCAEGSELTRPEPAFQSLKQLAGFSVPVFHAPKWVREQKGWWRAGEGEECVGGRGRRGAEVRGEKGHLQATSFEFNSHGPCGGAEGPVVLI